MLIFALSSIGVFLLLGVAAIVRAARVAPDGVEDDLGFRVSAEFALEYPESVRASLNSDCESQAELVTPGLENHAFPLVGDTI